MTVFTPRPDQRLDIGQAGTRRIRILSRVRIERSLLGSGLLHLLLLLALLLLMLPAPPREAGTSNPVTVIFEPAQPGSRKDQPEGRPPPAAPEAGPQVPPPPGNQAAPPPPPPPSAPLPVPPLPAPAPVIAEPPIPAPPVPPPPVPEAAAPAPAPPPPAATAEPPPSSPRPPVAPSRPHPPIPQPAAPPRPRAEPRRAVPQAESSLSAPMNFSFGGASVNPLPTRPTGRRNTIDPTIGAEAANRVGAPPTDVHRPDASIRVTGAQVGSDWITLLHAWWNQHGYYPEQAARNGEDGIVRVHVAVDRYGHVLGVELTGKSGSQWLDLGAQAVFRDARLPPFPPSTPESRADLDLTIRYYLVRP